MQRASLLSILALGLVTSASAQQPSIFVDIGSLSAGSGVPSAGYAAAAPFGGQWNAMDADLINGQVSYTTPALMDTAGASTAATLTYSSIVGNLLSFNFNEPSTMGDDAALIDDIAYGAGPSELQFDGLPAGTYDVITYAMAPDSAGFRTSVSVVNSADPSQDIGGDFLAGFVQGTTHAVHTVMVGGAGSIIIELDAASGSDSVNGVQILPTGSVGGLGINYCGPAVVNSSGQSAIMLAAGSSAVASNDVSLTCAQMPPLAFGFFIVSPSQGFVANPGGSSGNLCLGGSVGRYVGPGQIQNSGVAGEISLALDLTNVPQPNGAIAIQPGQSWNWQTWFRDSSGGAPTSNFSDGLQIDFQ